MVLFKKIAWKTFDSQRVCPSRWLLCGNYNFLKNCHAFTSLNIFLLYIMNWSFLTIFSGKRISVASYCPVRANSALFYLKVWLTVNTLRGFSSTLSQWSRPFSPLTCFPTHSNIFIFRQKMPSSCFSRLYSLLSM